MKTISVLDLKKDIDPQRIWLRELKTNKIKKISMKKVARGPSSKKQLCFNSWEIFHEHYAEAQNKNASKYFGCPHHCNL